GCGAGFDDPDQDAARDASRVLELDSKDTKALTTRAGALYQMKDYAGAAEDARRALEANPKNPQALSLLRLSESRAGRPEGEVRRDSTGDPLPGRLEPRPTAPFAQTSGPNIALSGQLARMAANAMRLGDHAAALREAEKALAANPDNLQAYHLRAMAYLWLDRPREAYADTVEALRRAPGNLALLVTQANALNRMRNFAEAKAAAEAALRSDPNSADAWYNLAYAQAGLGDRSGSLDALRRAAQISPAQYEARYRSAIQLPDSGDLLMLFAAEGKPAQEARPAPPARRSRLPLFLFLGAVLMALGLKGRELVSFLKISRLRMTGRRAAVSVVPLEDFSDAE
ncbi:MAG: tetratricopeptide repeat protein, partial [Elusimicrobiota bacterium]